MELDVEELEGLKRKLIIEIPEEVVSKRINKAYSQLNQQIKMPGFRPGKIPRGLLEKQVPVQSFTQMFQELMQEYYEKALQESGIVPAGPPEMDHSGMQDIKKDSPLSFSVILDIKPTVQLMDYKGLKFEKREHQVTDAEVDMTIKKYMEPYGHFEIQNDDHAVEVDDHLVVDFDGSLEGGPLENGSAKDYPVTIGDKKMIAGFEDQLVGHKKDEEFEVKVTLPADWNKKLRRVSMPVPGAENETSDDLATFKVNIKVIKKLILPELTDDFVQREGEKDVEGFRRRVKGDLHAFKEHQEEQGIKQDIFNKLVKEHDIDLPESLVNLEIQFMVEGMKFQIQQSGMKLEDSGFDEEQAKKEWREKAEFNTKGYQVLDAIAANEKITVNQSDLEQEYQRLAKETKMPVEKVKKRLLGNPEYLNSTTTRLRGQKALNFIYSHCEFEYIKREPKDAKGSVDHEKPTETAQSGN